MYKKIKFTIGERHGGLIYTGVKKRDSKGRWLDEFRCDCGNLCYFRSDMVKRGSQGSCGCKSPNHAYRARWLKYGENYPYYVIWKRCESRCDSREIKMDITPQDIKNQYIKQDGKCYYTGVDLILPKNFIVAVHEDVVSVDRIDSSKGYTPENIQLVNKKINNMKNVFSSEEFIAICHKVASRFPIA